MSLFTDRYYLNLALTVLFIAGIGFSLYSIYSLPGHLSLSSGYHPEMLSVYVITILTFITGVLGLSSAMRYKKEIVVLRDRVLDTQKTSTEGTDASKTTISLETVKSSVNQSRSEKDLLQSGLHAICKQIEAGQGALYKIVEDEGKQKIELRQGYALAIGESKVISYELGEGLIGQSAASARTLYVDDVPEGYIKIVSGLGTASPRYLLIVPLKQQNQVVGVIEIASFTSISEDQRQFVEESAQLIADKISNKA